MRGDGTVVVRRNSFLTAFFTGLFGLASVIVLCAGGIGFYAMNMVDRKTSQILDPTLGTVRSLVSNWKETLPPALADAVNDRRAPEYRSELEVTAKMLKERRHGMNRVAIMIDNTGDEMITLLAGRIVLTNESGDPIDTDGFYAATPLTLDDDDWSGPIMPHSKRQIVQYVGQATDSNTNAAFEITDLRVWKKEP
ncbi:MAG: hypothetical protein AB7N71_07255, partial [Phycisphaerae bacterium]